MSEPATDTPECAHSASISGAHTEEGDQIVSNMTDTADAHKVVHTDTGVHDAISISDSSAVLTEGSVGPIGDIQSISDISSSTCYVDVQNSDIQPSADIMQAAGESALSQDQMEAHAAFQADINQQVMSSELQGDEAVGQFHAEMQQGEVTEETTTIYAYIDSEGNLRGRSSTGEDVLLQVEGDMPDDISSDAILEDNGNVVVIQNCDPDSMIHTEGDVTYIVQQQPDEDDISDQALQQQHIPFPANANAQLKDNIGGNQEETNSATAAANLVYFEEEACSLETAEFQIVGVEVETQGQENQTEPSIIIDGCQVICQEPSSSSSSSSKKRKSPNKQESTSPAKSNSKPKKPRKRKSSQKDSSPLSDGTAEEPKEKVTVQNLYDKSVEMCITENNSSQKLPDNPTAVNDTEDPSPKSKRRNKGDPSKPRRKSKKSSEQDGNSSPRGAIVSTEQGKFEESDLSKTLDTATSVINQTMSAVGCEDVPCGSALVASPAPQAVPFSCRLCHKFSSHTEEEVKTHIVKEHARKICFIYRCDLCPAFFVTEPEITEHFKEKHPVAHVENISIVTDIEKALQTSADNIKIFYEKKKSGSSTSEVANIPQSPPPFPSQHKAKSPKRNMSNKPNLPPIQSDIAALIESQLKTAAADKGLLDHAVQMIESSERTVTPGTPMGQGPVCPPMQTIQPPLSAPPQLPGPNGSQQIYVCRLCKDFSSSIQWLVRNHVLSEHIRNFPSVVHLCYACPFVGKNKEHINEHMVKEHPGLPTSKVKVISDLEMLLILYASATDISQKGKIFHWNVKTNNHEEVQDGSQTGMLTKYVCSVCEKFETHFEWHLRHHIAQEHTEGVGYLCDLCCIFGTMEKHKAMLHCRLRHPKEQPNYKVLEWTVIFDTVVRVTDSYYTVSNVVTSNANLPNYFFGSDKTSIALASSKSAESPLVVPSGGLQSTHSLLEPGQIPPTVITANHSKAAAGLLSSSITSVTTTNPLAQVGVASRATSLSPAQPVDYSLAVSQSVIPATSLVSPASVVNNKNPQPIDKSLAGVPSNNAGQPVAKQTASTIDNILTVPVVTTSLQNQTVQGARQAPPPPLVLPPSGPQKPLGNDVHSFRCLVCHYTSLSLPDIVKHITVWHVDATMYPYTCPLCDLPGWEYNIILDHLRQIHKSSNYLPIINPGKVEFLRRYVNRFWIEHRPPALAETNQTTKTPRRRKRKTSVPVSEPTPDKVTQQQQATVITTDNAKQVVMPPLPDTVAIMNNSIVAQPAEQLGKVTSPTAEGTPKPKRRRRSNQQKSIQENFQIQPPTGSAGMQVIRTPVMPQQQMTMDPRFNSPVNRFAGPNQGQAADVAFTPPMVSPQRPQLQAVPANKPPAQTIQQPQQQQPSIVSQVIAPVLTNNKKGRNLDKGIRYFCKLCSYSTPQLVYADSHAKCTHLKIRPFYCPYCTSFAGALEHKAKMHVTFKHKDQPVKVHVNEEAVAMLEIEARKLYEARRTDDNSVVDIPQPVEQPVKTTALETPAVAQTVQAPTPQPQPTQTMTAAVTAPIGQQHMVQEVLIPVPTTEEVIPESIETPQMIPPIPTIQITESPGSNELPDELQIAVQSLMEGPIPEDDPLPVGVEAMTMPVEETAILTEVPTTSDLSLNVQPSVLLPEKLPATDQIMDESSSSSAVTPQQVAVTASSETAAQKAGPIVQHAVTEIAETMASMCSQVVIHQPKQANQSDEGSIGEEKIDGADSSTVNAASSDAVTKDDNVTNEILDSVKADSENVSGTIEASDTSDPNEKQPEEEEKSGENTEDNAISSIPENECVTENSTETGAFVKISSTPNTESKSSTESQEAEDTVAGSGDVQTETVPDSNLKQMHEQATTENITQKNVTADSVSRTDATLQCEKTEESVQNQKNEAAASSSSNPSITSPRKQEGSKHEIPAVEGASKGSRIVHYTLCEREGTVILEANIETTEDSPLSNNCERSNNVEVTWCSDEEQKLESDAVTKSMNCDTDALLASSAESGKDSVVVSNSCSSVEDGSNTVPVHSQLAIRNVISDEIENQISSQSDGNSDERSQAKSCTSDFNRKADISTKKKVNNFFFHSVSNCDSLADPGKCNTPIPSSSEIPAADMQEKSVSKAIGSVERESEAGKRKEGNTDISSDVCSQTNAIPEIDAAQDTKSTTENDTNTPSDHQSTVSVIASNATDHKTDGSSMLHDRVEGSTESNTSQASQASNDENTSKSDNHQESNIKPFITPDMVGDIAMDIVQETVGDVMNSICEQVVKEANCRKVKQFDQGHSIIVGHCTMDNIVPKGIFTSKSKLASQNNKNDSLMKHSEKCNLIDDVIKKIDDRIQKHKHLSYPYRPMPLSVKLKKYPGFECNNRHAPYTNSVDVDSSSSWCETVFYCKHCCQLKSSKSDLEVHIAHAHASTQPYHCSNCNFSSASSIQVQNHIDVVHMGPEQVQVTTDQSLATQLKTEVQNAVCNVRTDITDVKVFMKPVVTLPNIFHVLTENGNV